MEPDAAGSRDPDGHFKSRLADSESTNKGSEQPAFSYYEQMHTL